jgi:dihydrodipicolinate synthase/N-acetylneuraminate lyase
MSTGTGPQPPGEVTNSLRRGLVIPAHALALTQERRLDERRQRALSRYYLAAGAGGLAVGVHTTEFKIHDPTVGLYRPVLELAVGVSRESESGSGRGERAPVMVAGIIGDTAQAVREAETARELGYHLGLLGLGALRDADEPRLLEHAGAVAEVIPLMGFYLQPAVGGRVLAEGFWRRLAEIPNLAAIKIAPFDRYYTLAVVRAVAESGRAGEIALYTGNDDSILLDLLTEYRVQTGRGPVTLSIAGGLLGHWAYWTRRAVEQLEACREAREGGHVSSELLTLAAQVTESNEAVFDPEHSFQGCISGILYVLSRSGLLSGVHPIGDGEALSPGQAEKIDRVMELYPHLTDLEFVRENLERWLLP